MSCDCINEIERKLRDSGKVCATLLKMTPILLSGDSYSFETGNETVKIQYEYNVTKNERVRTVKENIFGAYCPFCGKALKKEPEDD
jgi:hypothetical protein